MGARRQGRILAFQSLYRYDLSHSPLDEILDFSWLTGERMEKLTDETAVFARLLIQGSIEKLNDIDPIIKQYLENWDFDRLASVDRALLRMSVYCLLFQQEIPFSVTIDEAVNIAKDYGSPDSYKFINGILDAIAKKHLHSGSA
jgi:N utilization substance protein B